MFTTGEFTKVARVTRRTLRHYREIGLFEPVGESESGYHYYTMEQLPRLHRILALRDLGFSLDQIRPMVDEEVDPAEMRGMLQLRKAEIEQELQEEQRRIRSIESRLALLESGIGDYEIVTKGLARQRLFGAVFHCTNPEHGREVLEHVLRDSPGAFDMSALGLLVTRMQTEDWNPDGSDIEIGYVVRGPHDIPPLSLAGLDFSTRELEPVQIAATTVVNEHPQAWHNGSEAIGAWMDSNGYRLSGWTREIWHDVGTGGLDSPVVEFQWPVEAAG